MSNQIMLVFGQIIKSNSLNTPSERGGVPDMALMVEVGVLVVPVPLPGTKVPGHPWWQELHFMVSGSPDSGAVTPGQTTTGRTLAIGSPLYWGLGLSETPPGAA